MLVFRRADAQAHLSDLTNRPLVALTFDKFADGRSFSYARILRDRRQFRGELRAIAGSPPLAGTRFDGCAFAERCGSTVDSCRTELPPLVPVAAGHFAACPVRNRVEEGVSS